MIRFDVGVFTYCGRYRATNEDSFLLCGRTAPEEKRKSSYGLSTLERKYGVAAVFDGMGGAKYGEVASGIVAELLIEHMEDILNLGRLGVDSYVVAANDAVCARARELRAPMGSTMVLISVSDESATVYNIGDSRAYLVRGNKIKQITKDHTVAASLSAIGMNGSAKNSSHQLTQHLGIPPDEIVVRAFSLGNFALESGDRILLCSDGLTDGLDDRKLLSIILQNKKPVEISSELVKAAAEGGSKDNISAMVFLFKNDGKPAKKYKKFSSSEPEPTESPRSGKQAILPCETKPGKRGVVVGEKSAAGLPAFAPKAASGKSMAGGDRFALFWLGNAVLALALGFVLGVISRLI